LRPTPVPTLFPYTTLFRSLFSMQDARNLIRFGGLDRATAILQMDPVLSYGVEEYADMLTAAADGGWSADRFIPHGGHHLAVAVRSEEHTSELQSQSNLVCR